MSWKAAQISATGENSDPDDRRAKIRSMLDDRRKVLHAGREGPRRHPTGRSPLDQLFHATDSPAPDILIESDHAKGLSARAIRPAVAQSDEGSAARTMST